MPASRPSKFQKAARWFGEFVLGSGIFYGLCSSAYWAVKRLNDVDDLNEKVPALEKAIAAVERSCDEKIRLQEREMLVRFDFLEKDRTARREPMLRDIAELKVRCDMRRR